MSTPRTSPFGRLLPVQIVSVIAIMTRLRVSLVLGGRRFFVNQSKVATQVRRF
jgi:hypothetical protein